MFVTVQLTNFGLLYVAIQSQCTGYICTIAFNAFVEFALVLLGFNHKLRQHRGAAWSKTSESSLTDKLYYIHFTKISLFFHFHLLITDILVQHSH